MTVDLYIVLFWLFLSPNSNIKSGNLSIVVIKHYIIIDIYSSSFIRRIKIKIVIIEIYAHANHHARDQTHHILLWHLKPNIICFEDLAFLILFSGPLKKKSRWYWLEWKSRILCHHKSVINLRRGKKKICCVK